MYCWYFHCYSHIINIIILQTFMSTVVIFFHELKPLFGLFLLLWLLFVAIFLQRRRMSLTLLKCASDFCTWLHYSWDNISIKFWTTKNLSPVVEVMNIFHISREKSFSCVFQVPQPDNGILPGCHGVLADVWSHQPAELPQRQKLDE